MLEVHDLCKNYESSSGKVIVLNNVSLSLMRGEFCALIGASGSGKTTLLNLVGLLDKPTSGSIKLNGIELAFLTPAMAANVRNRTVGFVFQTFHLLPHLTTTDNIGLPLRA